MCIRDSCGSVLRCSRLLGGGRAAREGERKNCACRCERGEWGGACHGGFFLLSLFFLGGDAVSYTHLDVYKRQGLFFANLPTLPTMIGFFAIAHLAYIVLFWRAPGISAPKRVPWWALVYAVWWVLTLTVVGPHAGALFVPLAIYGVVLGLTAAFSTRFGRLVACGGAFFLISDTFIALKEFMGLSLIHI